MRSAASLSLVLLPLLALSTACGDKDADSGATDSGASDSGATGASMDVALTFAADVAGEPVSCSSTYSGVGATGIDAGLADARLFVSAVALRDAEGAWVPLTLDQDSDWQHENVALLDWEDGTGACADSGNSQLNSLVTGRLPEGSYDAVRFDVGVPDALNHNDTATAPAPLNAPGMFWSWQTGFKHVRVDFVPGSGDVARWNVHVGSTGCSSDAATTPPDAPCDNPNRAHVLLEGFDPTSQLVTVDLAALVASADLLQDVVDSPPGCMSSPIETDDCSPVFDQLALDWSTGDCVADCADQAVFGVQ